MVHRLVNTKAHLSKLHFDVHHKNNEEIKNRISKYNKKI